MKIKTLLSVAIASSIAFTVAAKQADSHQGLALDIDSTPPERSGVRGGYADIVDLVAPSVVSIFTTREATASRMQGPGMEGMERFFENPALREFFENRGQMPGRGNRPRAPRNLPRQEGLGSGVILTADGYILTNNHVVEGADKIKVLTADGDEHNAEIVATDPASDIAVIKMEGEALPAVTLGDSETLRAGDFVLAIGSPFGLNHTVTSGIVSATGRDNLHITGYENFIQTDASINPGNSGGALIDNKGRVVGINTAILSRTGGNVGIGFAIPVNMAISIATEVIESGEISRGYLGVALGAIDDDLAEALGVENEGVLVNDVMPGTPAQRAGFEAGDVIVSAGGKPVLDMNKLRMMVGSTKPGAKLRFEVRRGDKELELVARIGEMPENFLSSNGPGNNSPSGDLDIEEGALEGVSLGTLDTDTREQLSLEQSIEGVVILAVARGSKAAQAGLRPGQVITEINRESVKTPRDAFAKATERNDKATLLGITDGK
ncbi:MAG: Do family serine endopeptidase, partial [Verrucomicrobiales bacterium]